MFGFFDSERFTTLGHQHDFSMLVESPGIYLREHKNRVITVKYGLWDGRTDGESDDDIL